MVVGKKRDFPETDQAIRKLHRMGQSFNRGLGAIPHRSIAGRKVKAAIMEKNAKRKAAGGVETIAAANQVKQTHYAMLLERYPGNDANAQRTRLYLALQNAPITTYEARKYLDTYDVPARCMELRAQGLRIDTLRVAQQTDAGVIHRRIGLYVLQPGSLSDE